MVSYWQSARSCQFKPAKPARCLAITRTSIIKRLVMLEMLRQLILMMMAKILTGSKMRRHTPLQLSSTQTTNTMKSLIYGAAMQKQRRWCARTNSPMRGQWRIALSWTRFLERLTSTAQDSISRALTKLQVGATPQVLAPLFWATTVTSKLKRKTKKRS